MSSVMLQGVLRMPPDMWSDGPIDVAQRHSRYIEAADKLAAIEELVTTDHETKEQFIQRVRAVLES